ncbi:MAG: PEP-CTERM sorting domain-containing protein [Thermoguttaceae bacterium]|jgi:hypothetical protein
MKSPIRIIISVLPFLFATASNADVLSNFNSGLDGWTAITSNGTPLSLSYDSIDGNPGGCVTTGLPELGDSYWMVAPAAFLGDWSKYNSIGTLSWDRIGSGGYLCGTPDSELRSTVIISGPGGTATYTADGLLTTSWKTFSAPIDSSNWIIDGVSWTSILQNVTSLKILISDGQEQKCYPQYIIFGETGIGSIAYAPITGMDNISLDPKPDPVPEPGSITLLFTGIIGLLACAWRKRK